MMFLKNNPQNGALQNGVKVLFFFLCCISLKSSPVDQNIKFEHISVESGLASNRTTAILQDSRGFLWFGTENGLHKFDGYNFTLYKPSPADTNSISHSFIQTIFEDNKDDIWIGTWGGGLNKFDRKNEIFINYSHNPQNPNSLSDNFVSAISQSSADSGNTLWIGTRWGGLNKLDLQTGIFHHYISRDRNNPGINAPGIFSLCFDKQGSLWIGTESSGLINFDPQTEKIIYYTADSAKNGLSDNKIRSVISDKEDNIWIGTSNGLNIFDKKKKGFSRFLNIKGNNKSLSHNHVLNIFEDSQENLWIGTFYGLNVYNKNTGDFQRYTSDQNGSSPISHDYINKIYEDRSGLIWIATLGGINKVNPNAKKFTHFKINLENSAKAGVNSIRSIQEDIEDNRYLWIGTAGAGLIRNNRDTKEFKQVYGGSETVFVRSLFQSKLFPGKIWIATWGLGLIKINKSLRQSAEKVFWFENSNNKDANYINLIYGLSDKLVLLGTGKGLYQFNLITGEYFGMFPDADDPNSLSHPLVTSICRDNSGQLWIGTYGGGLNKLKLSDGENNLKNTDQKFIHFKHNTGDRKSLSSNTVTFVYQARKGAIWIGTLDGGLNKLVIDQEEESHAFRETFIHYGEKDGLASDAIFGILEDKNENLWISTNKGISRFNPENESFFNYDKSDGLQSNQFNRFAYFKDGHGEFYFGGINGFNQFKPEIIEENPILPRVVITDFQLSNKSVKQYPDWSFGSVEEANEIILNYDQTMFTFEFAALEYTNSYKNKYSYKMEGIDPDWIYTNSSRRFATYTYLDPGDYIFRVKASNNDGIWNEYGTSVKITILPPWWKTWWAYSGYIVLFILLIYYLRRYEMNHIRLRNQIKIEETKLKEREQVDQMKSAFFANISHEFRTPLTLILGPLSKLILTEPDENKRHSMRIMQRNADFLLRLINQLLDFSKLESGKMNLQVRKGDIVSFVKGLLASFHTLAEQKNITYQFSSSWDSMELYFDREKAEKIFTNLISNAFKFTPNGGLVKVLISNETSLTTTNEKKSGKSPFGEKVNTDKDFLKITIFNTGPEIDPEQIERIFERFYQADDSLKREGTGIGLALAKELIELHKGEITIESKNAIGTTFTIHLPFGKEHLHPDEIVEDMNSEDWKQEAVEQLLSGNTSKENATLQIPVIKEQSETSGRSTDSVRQYPLILIVEDNPDMRYYMRECLESNYNIIEAENGELGIQQAVIHSPDLIISDVMMPRMDGFQFCKQIKKDERTCHIPVILLTAKAAEDSKIEGLETGADDYLTKPFDTRELQIRIRNLLEQRRQLQEKFRRDTRIKPSEITVTSLDEQLLQKAIITVEKNISDPDFDTTAFAKEVGLSRTLLNTKIKAFTGYTSGEFIRVLRLERAAQLLLQESGNVSEIAYEVGMYNLSYFAKTFREYFGKTPSQFTAI